LVDNYFTLHQALKTWAKLLKKVVFLYYRKRDDTDLSLFLFGSFSASFKPKFRYHENSCL